VHNVASTLWAEDTITYRNAPGLGATAATSGGVTGGTWTDTDVTALVGGSGAVSIALDSQSATALSLASRETTG
jgi:hypothetical protein